MLQNPLSNCPVDQINYFIKSNPKHVWIRHPMKSAPIGSGEYASVYQVCLQDKTTSVSSELKCNYVVKVIETPANVDHEKWLNRIKNEIDIQLEYEKLGLTIPVHQAYYCKEHGAFIVMEKRDTSLKDYVQSMVAKGVDEDFIISQIDIAQEDVLKFVKKAHQHLLTHNDMHSGNIMVNIDKKNNISDIVLIDFGRGKKVESVEAANKKEKETGIIMTYNMLKSMALEKPKKRSPPKIKKPVKKTKSTRIIESDDEVEDSRPIAIGRSLLFE